MQTLGTLSPVSKRTQLSSDELHQLRWLLGGIVTIVALATVAYIDMEGLWLVAVTAGITALTTLRPTLPARVPRWVHILAFPFIAAFFALDLWLRTELLPAMIRLDMLLLLYRALVYRQRREDLQLVVLGLFLVVVAGVLTVSLMFAAQILAYTACALVFLLVLTLVENQRSTGQPDATGAGSGPPGWATHVHWGRLLRRVLAAVDARIAALSVLLFVGLVAASALLFLLIPRFQLDTGMFLDRFISKKARTGFSDSIKFGDVTEIQQDTSIALHIDPTDPGLIPLAPYWRMLVLDDYENGVFRMSPSLRIQRFFPARTGSVVWGSGRFRRAPARWKIYLEAGVSRYLPLLGPFQQLRFAEPQTFQNAPDLALVALAKDPVTMTAYQVESFDLSNPPHDPPGGNYSDASSSRGLQASERALLRSLVGEAGGAADLRAADFATHVGGWLRQRHAYSLAPRIPAGAGDPLVRWANSTAAGHCELFAGSFVLLARSAGFRARVVTGFRGGTWNAYSNSFTVRNSDAHAWAEIFDPESGSWLRADPLEQPGAAQAAAAATENGLLRRTDRSWGARLDSLRVFWYRRVVSFDEQTQVRTLKVAKELAQAALQRLRERLTDAGGEVKQWWKAPWRPTRILLLAGVAVALVGLGVGWRALRALLLRWSVARGRRDDPIRCEAGRWLRRLDEKALIAPPPSAVVMDLQRLRYGPRHTWPDPASVFRQARAATKYRAVKNSDDLSEIRR